MIATGCYCYLFNFLMALYFFFPFRLSSDGQDFFTSYDEVYDSFDAMGLQENLLRGIYAYGIFNILSWDLPLVFYCFLMNKPPILSSNY